MKIKAKTKTKINVFIEKPNPRILYVIKWIFGERFDLDFTVVSEWNKIDFTIPLIVYGKCHENSFNVPMHGFLNQIGNEKMPEIDWFFWQDIPAFFEQQQNQKFDLPFDLFSAVFFLLSRYEEYQNYPKDEHQRYPHTESILFKNNCLEQPIVDEWLTELRIKIVEKLGIEIPKPDFIFQPTYDIDIAYSFLHKGAIRQAGSILKELTNNKLNNAYRHLLVGIRNKKDPYDAYTEMITKHRSRGISPIYFILAAEQNTDFDKNLPIKSVGMENLLIKLRQDGKLAIHPSYYSNENKQLLLNEKKAIESFTFRPITQSRQHYIRLNLPQTYRDLIQIEITDDYSMGYPNHFGFRAGTGSSFLWYDLKNETETTLRIHPFCMMDTTALFKMKLSPAQCLEKLNLMKAALIHNGSTMITIFHNFSLGTEPIWNGWKKMYFDFMKEAISHTFSKASV